MIKLINIITQIIIVLGCCAILIFTLSIAIAFAKNDFATITNIRALENKLKTLSNDIRTISES